jgi:hypothetical protein
MDPKRSYKVKLFPIRARFVFAYETGLRPTTKLLSTTSRYVKPSFRAALDVRNVGLPPKETPKEKPPDL